MLQKTQWMLASMALTVGACLMAAPRPAEAQVRIHLTRGSHVTTSLGTGIVIPPSGTGITTPPSSQGIVTPPSSSGIITPPSTPTPQATPVVTPSAPPASPPAPSVTPPTQTVSHTVVSTPAPAPPPVVIPPTQAAPQGFSAGPSLLGANRLDLGRYVDREGPAIIGDGGPTVQKVVAHH